MRGFVTQPLERSIAAADGIDYMESASKLGAVDHHGASAAELRFQKGAGRNQLQGGPGAQRSAARGGNSHAVNIATADSQVRLGLLEFFLGHSAGEPDHRISDPRRAAAAVRHRRRAKGGHPRRPHLCHAHLAQAGPAGGLQHQPQRGPPGAGGQQFSFRRRPHQRLAGAGQFDGQHGFAFGGGIQEAWSVRARTATNWCG